MIDHGIHFNVYTLMCEKGDLKKKKEINISNSFGYLYVIVDSITSFFFIEGELVSFVGDFVSFINL